VENYPPLPHLSGAEFAENLAAQSPRSAWKPCTRR
jgi:hypothetical protein